MKGRNRLINKVLIFLGILGILDTVILLLFVSINVGVVFPGLVGLVMVLTGINRQYKLLNLRISKRVRVLFKVLIMVWLISFIIIEGVIVFSSRSEEAAQVDYLVILGAGLRGRELSLTLQKRMEKGLAYLQSNPYVMVVVTGGQGFGEEIAEAEAMKNYLVGRGIEEDRIIKEDSSTSTMENFRFTKEILSQYKEGDIRILVVTNDFHLFRAKQLARRNGFVPYSLPSQTPLSVLPNCYIREYFAVIKSLVFDR